MSETDPVEVTHFIRPGNGYSFHCPTVGRDTRFMSCQFIRHRVWRGEDVSANDCKCAMRGGKCPAIVMIKMEWRDDAKFFDAEVKMHALPKEVQERIQNVMLVQGNALGIDLTPDQHKQLFGDSARVYVPTGVEADKASSTLSGKRRQKHRGLGAEATGDLTTGLAGVVHDNAAQINEAMEA